MRDWLFSTILLFGLVPGAGLAGNALATDPVKASIKVQAATERAAERSQQRIDQISDETRELLQEYRQASRELESLRAYDDHLERMVQTQEQTIAALEKQLEEVQVTHRDVLPLMGRMVETLGQFVELDVPFLPDERRTRIDQLQDLLDRPDASVAEKYRRVMEAYQVETDYGRSIEAYRGTLHDHSGERTVDFLRVGRIALLYRSLDGSQAGTWNPAARAWQALSRDYHPALKQGFRVARKQAAPELLMIPVPAPEAVQ
jgi:septal ring factor EnvC (AmiA/AmiB activator)